MSEKSDRAKNKCRIICAAIHWDNCKQYEHQPRNIKAGIVVSGWRHHNCIGTLISLKGWNQSQKQSTTQGFLTNSGIFLNRKEAAEFAFNAYQVDEKTKTLLSEDIY